MMMSKEHDDKNMWSEETNDQKRPAAKYPDQPAKQKPGLNSGNQQMVIEDKDNEDELDRSFWLECLCGEILFEILKFLDTLSLMTLINMSSRLQIFILDKRLWEYIDVSQQPLPLSILEEKLERCHDKTKCIKLRGTSSSHHNEVAIQHFNKTLQKSFANMCTKLVTLELFEVTLDFNKISIKDFPLTLKRLVLNTCNFRVVHYGSLFVGIHKVLFNLEELAIEYNSVFHPYNLKALSKLPILRYLSLKGCCQMHGCKLFIDIAVRYGFKQLEIVDLRDTFLNDSDLQTFYDVEKLKEIYLQCPARENRNSQISSTVADQLNLSSGEKLTTSNELANISELPSTSTNSTIADNNSSLEDTNTSTHSQYLPGAYCIDIDERKCVTFKPLLINSYENYLRFLQLPDETDEIENMVHHLIYGYNASPARRVVWIDRPHHLFNGENGAGCLITASTSIQQPRDTITDHGVCYFRRLSRSVDVRAVKMRRCYNRIKLFSVRGYKRVTNKSILYFAQSCPYLKFLDVSGTGVTNVGLRRFKKLRSDCKVIAEHLNDGV